MANRLLGCQLLIDYDFFVSSIVDEVPIYPRFICIRVSRQLDLIRTTKNSSRATTDLVGSTYCNHKKFLIVDGGAKLMLILATLLYLLEIDTSKQNSLFS